MSFTYYDSRLSGNRGQERKAPESDVLITFSPLTGRIYFSSGAVQRFGLEINRVTFVQVEDKPKDLFLFIDNKRGFKITSYRWSDYVNSKRAVQEVLDNFMGDVQLEPVKFKVALKTEKIDGHRMYRLELQMPGLGEKKEISSDEGRIKNQEINSGEKRVFRLP